MREERTQGARPLPSVGWSGQAFTGLFCGRERAKGFPGLPGGQSVLVAWQACEELFCLAVVPGNDCLGFGGFGEHVAAPVVHTTQKPERFRCRCRPIPKAVACRVAIISV